MKRRSFLAATTLATVGIATLIVEGCVDTKKDAGDKQTGADTSFELDEETISSLNDKLVTGKYSSEQLGSRTKVGG